MLATGELFISVFGNARRQQSISELSSGNPHQVFSTYANILGWGGSESSDEDSNDTTLWYIEEAGGDWDNNQIRSDSDCLLWVQVGMPYRTKRNIIPIMQIVACTEKTWIRMGFDIPSGVQLMIPLGCGPIDKPSWIAPLFDLHETHGSVSTILYEIEFGENDSCVRFANKIIEEANRDLARDGIRFEPPRIIDGTEYLLQEPGEMSRDLWMGHSSARIRTKVYIPEEFSFDVAGHIAKHVARSCQKLGINNHILTSASPT
ncbi:hypothetical protein E4P29_22695 [Rhodococcus sp. 1R11]|uniref:hypothetical protein n=1 Tax=Rhodococcus sp. 1R11 TaxID=2559614 RepID=UPI00107279CF|nr:hypothetical protein [Rhodococcus sp. 1R11]TFI40994.1 hypothetical protein E4P29_22695 [Rhodococcus sp. 1R11]